VVSVLDLVGGLLCMDFSFDSQVRGKPTSVLSAAILLAGVQEGDGYPVLTVPVLHEGSDFPLESGNSYATLP